MDTRKVATEYRMSRWSQMLQARQASGESIESFCETRGVSKNTYFYWQRKLREAACNELSCRNEEARGAPNGWARLAAPQANSASEGVAIEVGGCRVIATEEMDPELLLKVCRALRSL